jgi:hypothetical protein
VSGAAGAGGGSGGSAGEGDYFVSAVVDGVPTRAEMQAVTYWFQGLQPGYVTVEGQNADYQWYFVTMESALSPNGCSYLTLLPAGSNPEAALASFYEGKSCTVNITQEAPNVGDVLEGTFSATLGRSAMDEVIVTEGRFRVPRIAEMP